MKDLYSSYKDLPPIDLPDPGQVPRRGSSPRRPAARPRVHHEGLLLLRLDDAGLEAAYQAHRDAYERIFTRLGLEIVGLQADAGAMGGSKSEEFLHPTPIGEDTFVRSAGGYAANVEAFTTVVPADIDFTNAPAFEVQDTPDTPTIETLVELRQRGRTRAPTGAWTAADTLKNVVLAREAAHRRTPSSSSSACPATARST